MYKERGKSASSAKGYAARNWEGKEIKAGGGFIMFIASFKKFCDYSKEVI